MSRLREIGGMWRMRSIGRRVEALMVWGRAWESITSAYSVQKSLLRRVISW
jgi:hypothetical protein